MSETLCGWLYVRNRLLMPDDDIIKRRARAFARAGGRAAEEDKTEDFIIRRDVQRLFDVGIVCCPGSQPAAGVAKGGRGDDKVLADSSAGEDLFDTRHAARTVDAARYHDE